MEDRPLRGWVSMSDSDTDACSTPHGPGITPQARFEPRETARSHDVGSETRPRIRQRDTAIASGRGPPPLLPRERGCPSATTSTTEGPVRSSEGDVDVLHIDNVYYMEDIDFASTRSEASEPDLDSMAWPQLSRTPSPPPGLGRKRPRSRTIEYPIRSASCPPITPEPRAPQLSSDIPTLPDYPPLDDDLREGNELEIHIDDGPRPRAARPGKTGARSAHKSFSHLIMSGLSVKLGDNSVHTDGVTVDILTSMPPTAVSPIPNYISHMSQHVHASSGSFETSGGARRIISHLMRRQAGGGCLPEVEVSAPVFRLFDAPVDDKEIATCEVSFTAPVWKGSIPLEAIENFKRGGVPDERAVHSALNPILHPADLNVTRQLSHYIEDQALIPNNMMMYAKLLWHMMIHVTNTTYGHAAAAIAFPEGNNPGWISLADAATSAQQIANAFLRGDIMLVENVDYFGGDDLQIVYWLTKPGRRLTSPDKTQCPHACYMKWPSIPVTILGRGAAPAAPQAAALSWHKVWQFVTRMASSRNEQQDLVMGLYWVLTHFGIAYFNTKAHPIYEFVLPDLGCNNIPTPRPTDYNFIARLLHIFPAPQSEWVSEIRAWESCSAEALTDLAVVYSYAMSVFAGNTFYNYNITPWLLTGYNMGNLPQGSLSQAVLQALTATQGHNQESKVHQMVWASFKTYLGVNPCTGVACGRPWSGQYGHRADAATSYSAFVPHQAPRLHSFLALDDWLVSRPLEWGVPGDNTSADFSTEVCQLGHANNLGWFGNRGSADYAQAVKGNAPFRICPYGSMALTTIGQATNSHPKVYVQQSAWTFGFDPQWSPPVYNEVGSWNNELHVLEPGSLMSYDYINNNVLAPCLLIGPHHWPEPRGTLTYLATLKGQKLDCVGITIKSALQIGVATAMFHGLDMGAFFGSGGTASSAASSAPASTLNNPVPTTRLDNDGQGTTTGGIAGASASGLLPSHPP